MKKSIFFFLLVGTMIMMVVMSRTGASLKTPLTPLGILNLEFAYNAEKANSVIEIWAGGSSIDNIRAAKFNTQLDFIFLLFYASLLFYLCRELAATAAGSLQTVGKLLPNGALLAGLFDILENAGMLISLNTHSTDASAPFTFICSVSKWALVLVSILYVLIAGPFILYKSKRKTSTRPL